MKISLSQYAGFCDGVGRAYKIVKKAAKSRRIKRPVFVLGSLVHNSDVVRKIEGMGIRRIDREKLQNPRLKIGTLIITAHGVGPDIYEMMKKRKIDIVDTTCPKVIKVQRLAKVFNDRQYQIIIVGEKKHKEVKGIQEWTGKRAKIIESEKDFKKIKVEGKKKIILISQTTQNQDFVKKVASELKKKYKQLEIMDTLCSTTHCRQDEVKKLAKDNDILIIIGSPQSSNSTRLWEISKNINPHAYFVEQADQIKKEWFKKCQRTGVTAGASTPDWIIRAVLNKLKKL